MLVNMKPKTLFSRDLFDDYYVKQITKKDAGPVNILMFGPFHFVVLPLYRCHTCRSTSYKHRAYLSCSNCRCVYYCSSNCQKRDWNDHRPRCKKERAEQSAGFRTWVAGLTKEGQPIQGEQFRQLLYAVCKKLTPTQLSFTASLEQRGTQWYYERIQPFDVEGHNKTRLGDKFSIEVWLEFVNNEEVIASRGVLVYCPELQWSERKMIIKKLKEIEWWSRFRWDRVIISIVLQLFPLYWLIFDSYSFTRWVYYETTLLIIMRITSWSKNRVPSIKEWIGCSIYLASYLSDDLFSFIWRLVVILLSLLLYGFYLYT